MLLSGCLILHDEDSYGQTGGLLLPINKKEGWGVLQEEEKRKPEYLEPWNPAIQLWS
jgi:hypothetical protein